MPGSPRSTSTARCRAATTSRRSSGASPATGPSPGRWPSTPPAWPAAPHRSARATRSKALVLRDLFGGYDAAALDEIGRGFAFEIVQRHLRVRHGAARRLAPHPGPRPGDRVRVARGVPAPDRRAAPLRRGAVHRARGRRRRRAHRADGRPQRARVGEGPAPRPVPRRPARRGVGVRRQLGRPRALGTRRPRACGCRAAGSSHVR